IETGRMARLSAGSCYLQYGETGMLCAATAQDSPTHLPFFPLTVEYREKTYAAGKIPGGFFKREGRPGESEVLSARQTDRPLRPLFPEGFMHETQVACFILSADQENDADTWAIMGASLSLNMSKIPFDTLVAGIRLGRIQGNWILNPTFEQLEYSDVDIVVAGSEDAIIMVEGGAVEVPESELLEGFEVAQKGIQELIEIQKEVLEGQGVPTMEWTPQEPDQSLKEKVTSMADERVAEALELHDKQERQQAMAAVEEDVVSRLQDEDEDWSEHEGDVKDVLRTIEKRNMRRQ
ncbi:MAG: polyribonucleotide nucleotidyltransferase, partial [Gemmatimonadetes bacterium]|nr:polyribonucleotide nucleotidyltransferase [Gemmatimonadota bacterium]NIR78722.1 polyribonucleotide nucleotidyltransferase [Gemmatimonadota bacterium]NIT87361.1 polyribonucleotide nucleotidyltransferase [Gemmatimonadota bacterium]NIU31205.1 polyribonucleotide nucleotidyltransferase [Gemmatimonadota bacterium]NIV61565.1 polyribonucleotide nucleotidyltransferase [Gemmatimonadota bacterium]